MADVYPTEAWPTNAEAIAFGGTTHESSQIPFLATGIGQGSSVPLVAQFNRMWHRVLKSIAPLRQLEVVEVSGLNIGVMPGDYQLGGTRKHFDGDASEAMTDDTTNYVYLDSSNTLTVSTSSFGSVTDSVPLAEVVTASGAIVSITDRRNYGRNAIPTSTSSSDTGTDETSYILDEDNAGAGVDLSLRFNRGSDDAEDAALFWDVSAGQFELRTQHSTGTLSKLNVLGVQISGTDMLDANGAAAVQSAVAAASGGLSHSSGALSVAVQQVNGTALSGGYVTVVAADGLALDVNGVEVALTSGGGLELSGTSPTKTLQLAEGESDMTHQAVYADANGGGAVGVLKATVAVGGTVAIYTTDAPFKIRIINAWSVAKGSGGGTWKVDDGATAVTDTVTVTSTDKTIDYAGTIDDAEHEISASGSLRVVGDGSTAECEVYILYVKVS